MFPNIFGFFLFFFEEISIFFARAAFAPPQVAHVGTASAASGIAGGLGGKAPQENETVMNFPNRILKKPFRTTSHENNKKIQNHTLSIKKS